MRKNIVIAEIMRHDFGLVSVSTVLHLTSFNKLISEPYL